MSGEEQDFLPLEVASTATTSWSALGWLLFTVLLLVAPVFVLAAWGWLL